jgi:hypothetical protein
MGWPIKESLYVAERRQANATIGVGAISRVSWRNIVITLVDPVLSVNAVNNNYFRIAREFQEGRVTRYNASIS